MRRSMIGVLAVLVALTALTATSASGKVGGPNGRIAFDRFEPALDDNVTYTANADGSDPKLLLPGYTSGMPNWSPDGTEVAVVSGLGQLCPPTCTGNTVVVNPDTGAYRVLASQGFPAVSTFCSLWSPDATHFACEGGNDFDASVNGIYTIRSSDGGGLTRLTDAGGGRDIPIDYSPHGTEIVFGRFDIPNRPADANSALFVVKVADGAVRRITPWGFADNRGSWSPDGTKIVFLLFTQTGAHTFEEGIATANADGSDVRQVTSSPTFDHQADWGVSP